MWSESMNSCYMNFLFSDQFKQMKFSVKNDFSEKYLKRMLNGFVEGIIWYD